MLWWASLPNKITAPSKEEIVKAQKQIDSLSCVYRIPLVRLHDNLMNSKAERTIFLKLENLQAIASFKLRPAANVLLSSVPDPSLKTRVITPSAGNMGQGVAWMVNYLNKLPTKFAEEVLVIAPDHLPDTKRQAMERMGVHCILVPFPTWWTLVDQQSSQGVEESELPPEHFCFHPQLRQHLDYEKEKWNNIFVHPVFDTKVMAGNGTIALEVLEDLPNPDSIIIPYGGGALACGIAAGIRATNSNVKIFAVEVETAAPLSAAWNSGKPEKIDYTPSFVDGMGGSSVLPEMFKIARELLDGVIMVSLDEIKQAIKLIAERNKTIVEGAGAASVAAALSGKAGNGKIVCICSGGGLNSKTLSSILLDEPILD